MACGCIADPANHGELSAIVSAGVPAVYTGANNLTPSGAGWVRSGGTPNSNDAYVYSANWCEGTDCGYWEVRQFFDDPTCNNLIFYVLEDEFGGPNRYGWYFQNGIQNFRRSPYHGTGSDFPIYYGPQGEPFEGQVGFSVGVRFAIYYNNGSVWLYENTQFTHDTNDFGPNESYRYDGLPTDRRWRLKVYVFPAAADAHSNEVVEALSTPSDVCATAEWEIPALQWSATATLEAGVIPRGGADTLRFNDGEGSHWYLCAPISDSGDELRSKVIKAARVTGKLTNAAAKVYTWDVNDEIEVSDLENGTNSVTGAIALPDTTQVTQSERKQVNCPNATLSTIRVEGDDTGAATRDRVDEILIESAVQGVRR